MSARIVAVADPNEQRAVQLAERCGARACRMLPELLRDPQIEVVDVCTPLEFHGEHAIESLESGKHVIVEKPMAASRDECAQMIKVARQNERLLLVAHTFRYYPAIRQLKEWIDANKLGNVMLFSSIVGDDDDPRHPFWRGALWEFGLHRVDLVRYLMGEIKSIDADFLNGHAISIQLGTVNGSATLAIVDSRTREDILLIGKRASAWLPSLALDVAVLNPYGSGSYSMETIRTNLRRAGVFAGCLCYSFFRHIALGARATAHYACLSDFAESIMTGNETAIVSDRDGLEAVSCLQRVETVLRSKEGTTL